MFYVYQYQLVIIPVLKYFLILCISVYQERTKEDSRESESFKDLLNARILEYVEEVLSPHFGGMMAFVKDCEKYLERGQMDHLKNEAG